MPYLSLDQLRLCEAWKRAGVKLPEYDVAALRKRTATEPIWVHFGPGNIFRGYVAALQQELLNRKLADRGIVVVDTWDSEASRSLEKAYDLLTLVVELHADGTEDRSVVASIAGVADLDPAADGLTLRDCFVAPSLQMVSLTITEKGYNLRTMDGALTPVAAADIAAGPDGDLKHTISILAGMLHQRFLTGAYPLAVVSMDNCSENGNLLRTAVVTIVEGWQAAGSVSHDFIDWLENSGKISFPWTMIDRITPRPSPDVRASLEADGITNLELLQTAKGSFVAPFVNTETSAYLVIEDDFPNGRPALEKVGVYMTDRETVNKVERMKVMTCLNPLHTALAVYGCLLGYPTIAAEMRDPLLQKLVRTIGYVEGLPVVVDPGIINPGEFIDDVVNERLPNPAIPDTPQRIATDTSQKIPVRFGQTLAAWQKRDPEHPATLTAIPLALAGWLRYLLGYDDNFQPMELSADPLLSDLKQKLHSIRLGDPESVTAETLAPLLSNRQIFLVDLHEVGLAEKVRSYLSEMVAGPGAVRATLARHLE